MGKIIGIDLGTTNSVVAVARNGTGTSTTTEADIDTNSGGIN